MEPLLNAISFLLLVIAGIFIISLPFILYGIIKILKNFNR